MKVKNYLVTGAAGFIGSHLANYLISKGNKVYTIDNLSTGFKSNINPKIKFIKGNCQDIRILKKIEGLNFEAIFHIAGQSSGEISFSKPNLDFESNLLSTIRIIELCLKTKNKRFIYASSMSVYGNNSKPSVSEISKTNPISFYGLSKLTSEKFMENYAKKGLKYTSLRLFNVYGPNQNMNNLKQGMISIYLKQIIDNSSIIIKGSGERYRDFIHVNDVVEIIIKILNKKSTINQLINIGTGVKTKVKDVIKILSKKFEIKNNKIKYKGFTQGDQFGIYSNNKKLISIIGNYNFTKLEKGIENMISSLKLK
tara:strand:+ start:1381 stop:2313 length:933 start_codon:yes stop_codon:yes gene_type:complete